MKNLKFIVLLFLLFPVLNTYSKSKKVAIRYKINQINGYNKKTGVSDSIGAYCRLDGIVQSPNFLAPKQLYFSIFDSTGAMAVRNTNSVFGYTPTPGDSVHVRGTLMQDTNRKSSSAFSFTALTWLNLDSIWLTPGSYPVRKPIVIGDTLREKYESQLVTIQNVFYTKGWDGDSVNGTSYGRIPTFKRNGGNVKVQMRIFFGMDLYKDPAPSTKNKVDITGIVSQGYNFSISPPYRKLIDSNTYFLIPIDTGYIKQSLISNIEEENPVFESTGIYPNPSTGIFNITIPGNIAPKQVLIEVSDLTGRQIFSKPILISGSYALNLLAYPAGIYVVRITSSDGSILRKKIIKLEE